MDTVPIHDDPEIPALLRRRATPPPALRQRVLAACAQEADDAWPWWQVLAAVFVFGLFLSTIAQPGGGDSHQDPALDYQTLAQLIPQE